MRLTLSQAAKSLQNGQVVAVPTETVYGLAASLNHPKAIDSVFTLKGRPHLNPLIVHFAELQEIEPYILRYHPGFKELSSMFWPGPLTCILPINSALPSRICAGLTTAGFRLPAHPLTHELLKKTGPLVMPSANLSGRPSATRPEHIEQDFGKNFPLLDGGICSKGIESTILMYQDPKWMIVRLGALSACDFANCLGYEPCFLKKNTQDQPLCPGQSFRHYAPQAHLILDKEVDQTTFSFILGFKEHSYPTDKHVILLGSLLEPLQVAKNLYHALRQLDQLNVDRAWIDMDFPQQGLWVTLRERLLRAAEK